MGKAGWDTVRATQDALRASKPAEGAWHGEADDAVSLFFATGMATCYMIS